MAWCRIYAPCSVCIDRGARVHAHARSLSTHKAGILLQFMPLRRFACIHWGFTRPSPDAAVPTGLLLPATPPVILTLLRVKSQSWPLRSWTTAPHSVRSWTSLLPKEPCWPRTPSRVEDGAGLCSSACQFPPTLSDILGPLRKSWASRLLDSGLHTTIAARLLSGSKSDSSFRVRVAAISFRSSRIFARGFRFYLVHSGPPRCP